MSNEDFRCTRCGSNRFVSISLDHGYTRLPQCVPCGAVHRGYSGRGWQDPRGGDSGWTPKDPAPAPVPVAAPDEEGTL